MLLRFLIPSIIDQTSKSDRDKAFQHRIKNFYARYSTIVDEKCNLSEFTQSVLLINVLFALK